MIYQALISCLTLWLAGHVLSDDSPAVKERVDDYICRSNRCNMLVDLMQNVINDKVDPCDDFYEYACGNWGLKYPVPKTETYSNVETFTENALKTLIMDFLESNVAPNDILRKEKLWYRSCMDVDGIEKLGLHPIIDIMNGIGGWPMLKKSDEWTNYTWQKVDDYYYETVGFHSLFVITVNPDSRNSDRNIINLDQPYLSIFDEILLNTNSTKMIQKYSEMIGNMTLILAKHTNNSVDVNEVRKDVQDLIEFEKALHSMKATPMKKLDVERMLNWMTIEELQVFYDLQTHSTETSKIDWLSVFNVTFSNIENIHIDKNEEIKVKEVQYLSKLAQLLDQTPERTIVNYVHWCFIFKTMKYLNNETSNLYLETVNEHYGIKVARARRETCFRELISKMDVTLGFEVVRRFIPPAEKKMIEEVSKYVRDAIAKLIQESSWLDEETKNVTVKKLQAMKQIIGYHDMFKNESAIRHYYDKLNITSNNYYENIIRYFKFSENYLQYLRKPQAPELREIMSPARWYSTYIADKNEFILTALKACSALYHYTSPLSVNYGSVGWYIGHEMSSAFDTYGRHFDLNGNVVDWWPKKMVTQYDWKTQCYVKQYDKFQGNGNLTLNENMADANGLQAAFIAYKKAMKNKSPVQQLLPGMEHLDGDKLFYLSYAAGFCESATPEYRKIKLVTDYHSAPKFRVNGGVSNTESFAAAFNCPVGSNMNPIKRCNIWQ